MTTGAVVVAVVTLEVVVDDGVGGRRLTVVEVRAGACVVGTDEAVVVVEGSAVDDVVAGPSTGRLAVSTLMPGS